MPALPRSDSLLFLVRHGATENNLARPPRLQGRRTDPPLSGEGRTQSAQAARLLAGRSLDAVISSPLARAWETARTIAAPHGLTVEQRPELTECDIGLWEGRTWPEIEAAEPAAWRLFQEDPAQHPYAGGENLTQVRDRVAPVLDGLLTAAPGREIVVVAHNVVQRAYLAGHLGLPLAQARRIVQHNCGVTILRWQAGRIQLLALNSILHLAQWD